MTVGRPTESGSLQSFKSARPKQVFRCRLDVHCSSQYLQDLRRQLCNSGHPQPERITVRSHPLQANMSDAQEPPQTSGGGSTIIIVILSIVVLLATVPTAILLVRLKLAYRKS